MKALIDLVPAVLFFGAILKYDIFVATAVLIPALFVAAAGHWLIDRKFPKMQFWVAVLALVLGGSTLLLGDPLFIKIKPSIVYTLFAIALFGSRYIGRKPLLARIPQKMLVMPDEVWDRLHTAWALFFLFAASMNILVFMNFDDVIWGAYKSFGVTILMLIFMLAHIPFLHPYLQADGQEKKEAS